MKQKWSPTKRYECLYCHLDIQIALHKHHLQKGKCIVLCANCHYILHRLFKSKKLDNMTAKQVLEYLDVIYRSSERQFSFHIPINEHKTS